MKVLYNWLKEFVDVAVPAKELATRLSFAGVAIDAVDDTPVGPALDAEVTTNRPDLLGHYGIAREVAAILRTTLKPVDPKLRESTETVQPEVRVEIAAPELCGRFTARILRGVKVGPSPDWLRQRLEALDQTPINNVVDATNYVMFELGRPLHAFDYDTLGGRRIIVRRAGQGEKLTTLDGVQRTLSSEMCVIADQSRAISLGGIMGGAATEISPTTRNLLLECAWFDPVAIRRASKALNLRTEASIRFERRADPEMAELASRRCAELIQQLAGGDILAGVVDVYPARAPANSLELTRKEFLRVMGADVPDAEMEAILRALGFAPSRADGHRGSRESLAAVWRCTQPSWRHDVSREVDLVEEVARHHGYEKFPPRLPASRQPAQRVPHAVAEDALRGRLVALGYQEIITIPLVDEPHDAIFRATSPTQKAATVARVANPLAEDAAVLRTSGIVNMLHALEWNLNRGRRNLRLFEIGRAYAVAGGQPVETPILTLGAAGLVRDKNIYQPARTFDFEDLKGDLEALLALCGGLHAQHGGPAWLQAGRAMQISLGDGTIGVAGQLARAAADQFKLKHDIWLAELRLEPLFAGYESQRAALQYRPLPRFPAVERDFSLVLSDAVTFEQVAAAIRGLGVKEVEAIEAVDLFRGGAIPAGKHSLLVRVTLQSYDATLSDAQVNDVSTRIVAALEGGLGAALRTS